MLRQVLRTERIKRLYQVWVLMLVKCSFRDCKNSDYKPFCIVLQRRLLIGLVPLNVVHVFKFMTCIIISSNQMLHREALMMNSRGHPVLMLR